ncbi:MAG: glycosyl hydrolase, partial [Candidatus Baltobacteraceae bacterium]
EFNGNWYPWGLVNQGASSATDAAFIAAWQRMVTIFHNEGATNVRFVWCFSAGSLKSGLTYPWNNPASAYPGDAYVDWIGYDTYNRGNLAMGVKWKSFDDITAAAYQAATAMSSVKPIAVSEMASTEYGDGGVMKTTWLTQMLRELSSPSNPYPNIKLFSWFESDIKGYVYDLQSTNPVFTAFANGIRDNDPNGVPYIRSNNAALANITGP